jgi:AcrR family transcriptional regulator
VTSTDRPLRRDAQRNRALLVTAARRVFATRGLNVPLEDVAREAGVSIGTLYNRFPTRGSLVDAALADKVATAVELAERAAAMDDAWDGFAWFLERTCELQASDRGFNDLCARQLDDAVEVEAHKARGFGLVRRVIENAQRAGALREDFDDGDFAFVLWSITRTIEATGQHAPNAWRRHLAFMLDGFRASAAYPLPGPALGPEDVLLGMRRLSGDE